jgi:hypothetical protein
MHMPRFRTACHIFGEPGSLSYFAAAAVMGSVILPGRVGSDAATLPLNIHRSAGSCGGPGRVGMITGMIELERGASVH